MSSGDDSLLPPIESSVAANNFFCNDGCDGQWGTLTTKVPAFCNATLSDLVFLHPENTWRSLGGYHLGSGGMAFRSVFMS